jgi:large subunit ribosomal protein L4
MKIDVYTATGTKKGSVELPAGLFEAPINKGLMHLALIRQQSNRRHSIAHVKHRGEIVGSTKKMFQQKGTGRARRGAIRSPLLRGGGKAFGPRNESNFFKDMPKKMRRAALFSCLSLRAKEGAVLGLENYPDDVKTKAFMALLKKLPVEFGRRITVVLPAHHRGLELSARNVPRVKTILAQYLNPEDILGSQRVIFLVEAIKVAEDTFLKADDRLEKRVGKIRDNEAKDAKEMKDAVEAKAKKVTKASKKPTKKPAAASAPKKAKKSAPAA